MSSQIVEIATTSDCLQNNGGKQSVLGGGYWFEIIEIDEKSESQRQLQSLEDECNTLANEKNTTSSRVTNDLYGGWSNLPWHCVTCMQVFNSAIKLINHNIDVHKTKASDMEWICHDCQLKFRHYNTHINHVRRMHRQNLALICDMCDKKCVSFHELDVHRIDGHQNCYTSGIRHCVTCGQCYRSAYSRRMHIETSHLINTNKIRFSCIVCKKTYRSKTALADHQLVHGTPNFTCEDCGKKFSRKIYLEKHIVTHMTARSYECRMCGKSFKTPSSLTSHIKSHTNTIRLCARRI